MQKIPGLTTVMFSIFEPGKHLPAHRGPYNGVLRLHLGMIVPEAEPDQLAIRVKDQICHWEEGKVLIFDDAYEHEAWNHTDKTRVVLFVDFVKPTRFPRPLRQLALDEHGDLHALHPRRPRQPQGLGKEVLRRGRGAQKPELRLVRPSMPLPAEMRERGSKATPDCVTSWSKGASGIRSQTSSSISSSLASLTKARRPNLDVSTARMVRSDCSIAACTAFDLGMVVVTDVPFGIDAANGNNGVLEFEPPDKFGCFLMENTAVDLPDKAAGNGDGKIGAIA